MRFFTREHPLSDFIPHGLALRRPGRVAERHPRAQLVLLADMLIRKLEIGDIARIRLGFRHFFGKFIFLAERIGKAGDEAVALRHAMDGLDGWRVLPSLAEVFEEAEAFRHERPLIKAVLPCRQVDGEAVAHAVDGMVVVITHGKRRIDHTGGMTVLRAEARIKPARAEAEIEDVARFAARPFIRNHAVRAGISVEAHRIVNREREIQLMPAQICGILHGLRHHAAGIVQRGRRHIDALRPRRVPLRVRILHAHLHAGALAEVKKVARDFVLVLRRLGKARRRLGFPFFGALLVALCLRKVRFALFDVGLGLHLVCLGFRFVGAGVGFRFLGVGTRVLELFKIRLRFIKRVFGLIERCRNLIDACRPGIGFGLRRFRRDRCRVVFDLDFSIRIRIGKTDGFREAVLLVADFRERFLHGGLAV